MFSLNLIVFTCICLLYTDEVFGKTDYCKFSPKHMLCGGGGFHTKCGGKGNYKYTDITKSEIEEVLDTHNNFRNELALGKVTGKDEKSYPKASNMEELKWDSEIGNIAAGMIKKCKYQHPCPGVSTCFQTDRHKFIGENISAKLGINLEQAVNETTFANVIQEWFVKGKDFYDPADVPKYRSGKNSLGKTPYNHGHFTQIIWWNTMRIGCAKIAFRGSNPNFIEILVTCHYAPAGNVESSDIYQKGEPCTNCSGHGRTCSTKYTGLCAAAGRPNDPDPGHSISHTGSSNPSRICFCKIVFLLCLSFISRII